MPDMRSNSEGDFFTESAVGNLGGFNFKPCGCGFEDVFENEGLLPCGLKPKGVELVIDGAAV